MKKFKILLVIPLLLSAQTFNEIIKNIPNSYLYKLSKNEIELSKKALKAAEGLNYGKIDASYTAVKFFERPKMKLTTTMPVAVAPDGVHLVYETFNTTLPMAEREHYTGILKYSYPLFTGYAITTTIKKEKINLLRTKLKFKNTKRVILLNTAKLYSGIYSLKAELKALDFAKNALKSAKEKVVALYNEGLVDKSQVDEIDAKYYEVLAQIKEVETQKEALLRALSTLLNTKITRIEGLPEIKLKSSLNPADRPDVKELYESLKIAKIEEKLAKSAFYPKIGFEAALKKEADNLFLNKNDYQNTDKSYLALGIEWNIFNGGSDRAKTEMAKIGKIQSFLYYRNYLNNAKKELKDDLSTLKALKYQLKAAKEEIKARESYYEKIRAKFEEGLADSVDLNKAIADLAKVKAKKEYIKSQIFFYTLKANLDGGYND